MAKRDCFLRGHGACRGKISGEHYFSESVLRELGDGKTLNMGGLSWQPENTLQPIGLGSLQSRILCEGHNSGLSRLDEVAGNFARTLNAIDKTSDTVSSVRQFSGRDVERWFLKALCGLVAAKQIPECQAVPDAWKALLAGTGWPPGTGLFVATSPGPHVLAQEIFLQTMIDRTTGQIAFVRFRLVGVTFHLVLRRVDRPSELGLHRPRAIIFQLDQTQKIVEFLWDQPTTDCVLYTKQGISSGPPPQWAEWTNGSA